MAPPDSDQDTSSQGDTSEISLTLSDSEASQINQTNDLTTFHYYIHLPFELRAQIRTEAIKSAQRWLQTKKDRGRLALVSKEWQDDVEKLMFGMIRIDPSNEGDVASFKRLFTDRRQKFLTRLDIAIDDDDKTSPWHKEMGLLLISQVMEKVGQFLHYINSWDFCKEGEKQQCIEIVFTAPPKNRRERDRTDEEPNVAISSLWEQENLDSLTRRGLIPTNIALWAVKSEFPSSLDMVTHLTFVPDCVPFPAAQKIVQTMPNLETCVLEVRFSSESEEGWRYLTSRIPPALNLETEHGTDAQEITDFIHQLRISAPSLRKLMLNSRNRSSRPFVPPSMERFATALRDYSQSLKLLHVSPFNLHPAFFLPFSKDFSPTVATSEWVWPRLQRLELRSFYTELRHLNSTQLKPATEILIAAARAAIVMPMLKSVTIEAGDKFFFVQRPGSKGAKNMTTGRLGLSRFKDESESARVLTAWVPFLGAEATFIDEVAFTRPPLRMYEFPTNDGAGL